MTSYVGRRLLMMIPVIVIVTAVLFALRQATPGDPATVAVGQETQLTKEEYEATLKSLRARYDLDRPLPVQYVLWAGRAVIGDLGRSYRSNQPVREAIIERLPVTLELGVLSLLVSWIIAVPAGVIAAKNRNKWPDLGANFVGLLGLSLPNIWVAFVLIYILGVKLEWLPPSGYVRLTDDPVGNLKALTIPVITLGTSGAAVIMRLTRSSLLEVIAQDYIRTARAKGLHERAILWRHGMRNALIPIATVVGLELGGLLGGAFIIEQIFSLPGMGKLAVDAIYARDYPIVQGVLLISTLTYLFANFAVDMLYGLLDPRIRYA
ncbi:MAG: ABC transporter permease [Tepidiformaceae bacterium]